ncbi:acylphosphatase [Treponema sp.]|uniref:acylphosphatase n=1 Tax=Treponema sp. TaxID=166 RepID=UPI00298EC38B|nr:acylphosphatase [Treponema sp.]MCR5613061.1 acylphosphatase [Treponema sp.]
MADKIRQQLRFTGRVQGVGFRYTANIIAQNLGLTGWVFNDFDGSVLMQVQGTKNGIDTMIERLRNGSYIEIDNVERTDMAVDTDEHSFRVKSW